MSSWHLSISAISHRLVTQCLSNIKGSVPGIIFNRCQLSRWHLSKRHMSWWHLSISAISQLLLPWFWPTFLGLIFWGAYFMYTTFFWTKLLLTKIFFGPKNIRTLLVLNQFFSHLLFLVLKSFGLKFWDKIFWTWNFWIQNVFQPKDFFGPTNSFSHPKFFSDPRNFLDTKFFMAQNFVVPKISFWPKSFRN